MRFASTGPGRPPLSNYVRYIIRFNLYPQPPTYAYWNNATRSYESGSETGYFAEQCEFCDSSFLTYDYRTTVDLVTQNSVYLILN